MTQPGVHLPWTRTLVKGRWKEGKQRYSAGSVHLFHRILILRFYKNTPPRRPVLIIIQKITTQADNAGHTVDNIRQLDIFILIYTTKFICENTAGRAWLNRYISTIFSL